MEKNIKNEGKLRRNMENVENFDKKSETNAKNIEKMKKIEKKCRKNVKKVGKLTILPKRSAKASKKRKLDIKSGKSIKNEGKFNPASP